MSENVVKFSGRAGTEDPAFDLIAKKRAADVAHCEAIDAQNAAGDYYGYHSEAAYHFHGRIKNLNAFSRAE
jgi:hypothetical protein